MKIVITGSLGQLGSALQHELREHELVAVDVGELDITSFHAVTRFLSHEAPDLVINAAAYTNVDGAESNPESAYRVNALGPRNLAIATADLGVPIFHVSTDYVFDGRGTRPYHEYDVPAPRSVYGTSKLAGEEAIRAHNPRHYIARTAWLYSTVGKNFPKTMIGLSSKPELSVVSDQYGSPTYAPHLAHAMSRLLATNAFGTYHLAGRGAASWFELTQTLFRLLEIRTPVRPVATADFPRPAPRPTYAALTTIQTPEILLPPWTEGLEEFCAAVRAGIVEV